MQKQKEIGILRAMGAGTGQMMGVFLLQGGLLGLAGALLGMAFAFGLLQTLHWLAPDSIFAEVQLSPATLLASRRSTRTRSSWIGWIQPSATDG